MASESTEAALDPFEVGQITEKLPKWELWDDGVEPADDEIPMERDRAA